MSAFRHSMYVFFFFQAEDGIRDVAVTGVQNVCSSDLVIAVGPVVQEVTRDFERYWTSGSAVPAAHVVAPAAESPTVDIEAATQRIEHDPVGVKYIHAVARAPFVRDLLEGNLRLEWANVHMVSDDPAKGLARAPDDRMLWNRLKEIMDSPKRELELVSPYFVPGEEGVKELRSEEHTSELQSRLHLVCRLLLEKKKTPHATYRLKSRDNLAI